MPKLGHAARVRAHMRRIGECVQDAIGTIEEGGSLERIVDLLNQKDTPWKYTAGYTGGEQRRGAWIASTSVAGILKVHQEIASVLAKWTQDGASDHEIDRASGQIKELGIMAWALEREKRGQMPGSRYLTLDVDPVSLRLLAFIHSAREDREDEDGLLYIEDARLAKTLTGDDQENLRKARRTLQRMIDSQGDEMVLREEYSIRQSDIPHLRTINVTIENGSARTSLIFFGQSQISNITDGRISLRFQLPDTQAAGFQGKPLRNVIQHPLTDGLGLNVTGIETYTTQQGRISAIRTDACDRSKLTAMVMNMEDA